MLDVEIKESIKKLIEQASDKTRSAVYWNIMGIVKTALKQDRDRIIGLIKQAGEVSDYGPVQTWALEMVKQIEEGGE